MAHAFNDLTRRDMLVQSFAGIVVAPLLPRSAASLTARAFDADGRPAAARQLESLLLIDADGRPFELLPQMKGDGVCTIDLPDRDFQVMMRLPVAGFGEVYLYADDVRGPEAVLNYEFARSRAAVVRRYVRAAEADGVTFSAAMTKRLDAGEAALRLASSAGAMPARVKYSNESLVETMWAGEMAAVERAQHRIRRNGPRPGFLFGANVFGFAGSDQYRQQFTSLFNFGTVPFYRDTVERAEGVRNYSRVDAILEKAAGTSLLLKGHPLLWFKRQNMPEFFRQKKTWAEVKASSVDYALNTVGRYRSRIHAWDVINEAHDWANEFHFTPDQMVEITALMSRSARRADPTAFRVVNNCCLWAEYAATRMTNNTPLDRPSRTPLEYVKSLRDAKVDYDAVGLQIYAPGRDMLEIERHVQRFVALGKPIHITELGIPSTNDRRTESTYEERGRTIPYPIDAVWHGTAWSEEIQADWVEQFYTLCYSIPEVEAITWWDFTDPGYMPNGGLLTRDFRPKPAYDRLSTLIAQWRAA
jgi:GH35 family endo-1,4-beta-xylanase